MITARALVGTDLDAVVELLEAYDRRWFGEPFLTADDVRAGWGAPGFVLAEDSEGWDEDGALVAFGTLAQAHVELAVRDDWAGAGLEDALLDRWEGEARRRGLDAVHRHLAAADAPGLALLADRGWEVVRPGWSLRLEARTPVVLPELAAGYALRPMREADLPAVHALVTQAFAAYGPTRGYADWRAGTVDRPDATVRHGRVVTRDDEVVGACLVLDPPAAGLGAAGPGAEAWVPELAVGERHRRQGLGRALLGATALAARERGVPRLGLYTHSATGALGLYESVGLVVRHSLLECRLTL